MVVIQDIHIGDEFYDIISEKIGEVIGVARFADDSYKITLQFDDDTSTVTDLSNLEEPRYTIGPVGIMYNVLREAFPEVNSLDILDRSPEIFKDFMQKMEEEGYIAKQKE